MAYASEIVAVLRDAATFQGTVRANKIKGVSIVYGMTDGALEPVSIHFDSGTFTVISAAQWLSDNGYTPIELRDGLERRADAKDDAQGDSKVWRFDRSEPAKVRLDSQGFAHFDLATLTTVGVYEYRQADGSISREYRPASEVQSPSFVESLKNCVVTREHPSPRGTPVTAKNYKRFEIGSTGTDVRTNGLRVDSSIAVRDSAAVRWISDLRDTGKQVGISVGYRCDTRKESGVWHGPNGPKPYDAIQVGHVANHVAITVAPRGGEDTRLHLDSTEAEQVDERHTMENTKIDIGGVTIEVLAVHAPLLQDRLNRLDSDGAKIKADLESAAKSLGIAEGKIAQLEKERDQLKLDSEIDLGALIAERQALIERASKVVAPAEIAKIDAKAKDYSDRIVALVLDSHKIETPKGIEGEAARAYRLARFDSLADAAGKDAHTRLTSTVATRRNSGDWRDDSYRAALDKRLEDAQTKMVGARK